MDRFIAVKTASGTDVEKTFKIQYGQIYRSYSVQNVLYVLNLKSNMDRFIVDKKQADYNVIIFKIQYGQIYSQSTLNIANNLARFKIQYGQIYSRQIR